MIWTVNHIIDKESPLYGLTSQDLKYGHAEFLILLQGFDDTFSQTVHSHSSYRQEEIIWGAKFVSVFGFDYNGRTTVNLDRISDYESN